MHRIKIIEISEGKEIQATGEILKAKPTKQKKPNTQ